MDTLTKSKPTIYNRPQAAEALGIGPETLQYHIDRGHIVPDYELSTGVLFLEETLADFRRRHQSMGLTFNEAAAEFDINVNTLRYHFYGTGRLKADGRRGAAYTFNRSTLVQFLQELDHEAVTA